jgi:His-Xaa-Ser system protein HxsD
MNLPPLATESDPVTNNVRTRKADTSTNDVLVSDVVVDFSASTQSLGALQEAAYRLIGRASCHIDQANGRYVCRLSPSQPQFQGDDLRSHFLNLVTDENLREKVRVETDRLRDVIVALAFGSLVGES